MKFLLFDIDGTLIDSGGAGSRSLDIAFEQMFGIPEAFRNISMAGKTDTQILREGMVLHDIPFSAETASVFFDHYIRILGTEMKTTRGEIKKGICEALEALRIEELHVLGLLTGNIRDGANIKLKNFGLDCFFEVGAFGNDSEDRNQLLPVAVDKLYRSRSLLVDYRDCVVIGDTPRDVACAKAYGALSIAVATGPYTADSLEEAGADVVFEDLSDTERFLSSLTARAAV